MWKKKELCVGATTKFAVTELTSKRYSPTVLSFLKHLAEYYPGLQSGFQYLSITHSLINAYTCELIVVFAINTVQNI